MVTESEQDAYETPASLVGLLGAQGHCEAEVSVRSFGDLLPQRSERAYDIKPVVSGLLDGDQVELHGNIPL